MIGPESANNSVEAGDFIPTLLFSVPGGAPSAILLGALFFYGIQPGPRMVQENLDLIFTIIWSFAIANTIGAGLCFLFEPGPGAAHLGSLRSAGSGHRRHDFFWRLSKLPAVRRYLRHAGLGIAGLAHEAIGMAARAFSRRLRFDQADRTVSMAIDQPLRFRMAAGGPESLFWVSCCWRPYLDRPPETAAAKTSRPRSPPRERLFLGKLPSVLFTILVLLVVAAALYEAQDFPHLGAIFPMAATIPAIFMAAAQIVLDVRATREAPGIETRKKTKLALGYFLSLVLYLLLILLFGFGIATAFSLLFFSTAGCARAGSCADLHRRRRRRRRCS